MTKDGLVEFNVSTGEEVRVSQRGQEFQLRAEQPKQQQSFAPERDSRSGHTRRTQRATGAASSGQADNIRQDSAPTLEATHAQNAAHQSTEAPAQNAPGASPALKATVADSTGTEEQSPRHDSPRPSQRGTAYHNHVAENTVRNGTESRITPDHGHSRLAERLTLHESTPAELSARDRPDTDERSVLSERSGRLRFDNSSGASASPAASSAQRGTKYLQRFIKDAAPETAKTDTPVSTADTPSAKTKPDAPAVVDDPVDTAVTPPKPSKLQFAPDDQPPAKPDTSRSGKKMATALTKADKSAVKLDKARQKLPTTRRIRMEKIFDAEKGKPVRHLQFGKKVKSQYDHIKGPLPLRPVKAAGNAASGYAHKKIYQVEHENVGTEAAHKAEIMAEGLGRTALRFNKTRPYRRVAKLQKKATQKAINYSYRKVLHDNPKLRSNPLARMIQKHKIKRQYAKAAKEAKRAGSALKAAGNILAKTTRAVVGAVVRHPAVFGIIALILLVVIMFTGMFSSCSNLAAGGLSSVLASSYLAEDADMNAAEIIYTEWENDLREEIENVETDYPDYDEYNYDLDAIGHNPHELMAWLTAVYRNFQFDDVYDALREVFEEQYTLEFKDEVEVRYADPDDSDDDGDTEPYNYYILNITLTTKPFTEVIAPRLDEAQQELNNLIIESGGNRQYVMSPFAFDWSPYITSYFGYRANPITGVSEFHTGIDIAVASGTPIIAAHDGVVTSVVYGSTGYGYQLVVSGADGISTRYAHCSALLASVGQEVKAGDVIARVGSTGQSTGPHLHFEVIKDGAVINPIYFAQLTTNP